MSKINSPWATLLSKFLLTINLLIVSKFCEQFFSMSNFCGLWAIFCRRQQQDNRAGRSSFEPARHGTGNGFASGRRVYSIIHDLPRIAGPSRTMRGSVARPPQKSRVLLPAQADPCRRAKQKQKYSERYCFVVVVLKTCPYQWHDNSKLLNSFVDPNTMTYLQQMWISFLSGFFE